MATTLTMEFLNSSLMQKIFQFELFKVREQDKEDVKHSCIVEILKALKKYGHEIPDDKLPSFCQVIIRRTVVDFIRKSTRKIESETMLINPYYLYSPHLVDKNSETSEIDAVRELYGVSMTKLCSVCTKTDVRYDLASVKIDYEMNRYKFSPREREVIDYLLYHVDKDYTNMAEIAKDLQIDKSHVTRALKRLRKICR